MSLVVCPACGAGLNLLGETWDEPSRTFVWSLACPDCRAEYLEPRRPHETRPVAGAPPAPATSETKEPFTMFTSHDLEAHFKDAKLRLVVDGDDPQKIAECRFVIEPFTYALAKELGASVAAHFFAKGGVMQGEVAKLELACPDSEYQLVVKRHKDLTRHTLRIRPVRATAAKVERQDDEKAGTAWFRLTLTLSFAVHDRPARDFVVDGFGGQWCLTLQETQRRLIGGDDAEATGATHPEA